MQRPETASDPSAIVSRWRKRLESMSFARTRETYNNFSFGRQSNLLPAAPRRFPLCTDALEEKYRYLL
jgi:hypothetical protein